MGVACLLVYRVAGLKALLNDQRQYQRVSWIQIVYEDEQVLLRVNALVDLREEFLQSICEGMESIAP